MFDTVDKIITSYFYCVADENFTHKGKTYEKRGLKVSPLLFRNLICNAKCGACCVRYSLDWLPSEVEFMSPATAALAMPREVEFNGRLITIYSDLQADNTDRLCKHLNKEDGRCGIHTEHPFPCDFEIIRAFIHKDGPHRIATQFHGRGWNMQRIDGKRGTLCEMYEGFNESKTSVLRKLRRLQDWTDHFQLKTKIGAVTEWIEGLTDIPEDIKEFS